MRRYRIELQGGGRPGQAGGPAAKPDKNEAFILKTGAVYLDRILENFRGLDSETLDFAGWVLGPTFIKESAGLLAEHLSRKHGRELAEEMAEWTLSAEDYGRAMAAFLVRARKNAQVRFLDFLGAALEKRIKELDRRGRSEIEKNAAAMACLIGLDDLEREFLIFLFLVSTIGKFESYFVDHLVCHAMTNRKYLQAMFQVGRLEAARLFQGTLARLEIIEYERHDFRMKDEFLLLFENPEAIGTQKSLGRAFFAKLSGRVLPLDSFLVDPVQRELLVKLFKSEPITSTHILLYGSPGTGKTSFARSLIKEVGLPGYEIAHAVGNESCMRRAAIQACLNLTKQGTGAMVLVDEADNLLNTESSWPFGWDHRDKGWLNQLMDEPGVRMIWITNRIDGIEESVLRRFAFSLPFRPLGRRQRTQVWTTALRRRKAGRRLDKKDLQELAAGYPVSAGAIDLAVKKAVELGAPDKHVFKKTVTMFLETQRTLLNGGRSPAPKERIEPGYALEGLNVKGDLAWMFSQLEAFDQYLRRPDPDRRVSMNLLFYGPPGAGKSEMARYLGQRLDRELLIRRTSDLLSPWIGGTEENLAQAFAEASQNGAILVIDEADSLLFARDRALRSWEISMTNEFLTQMENFQGILICTTNRLIDLDEASIRRFSVKLEFGCLEPEGKVIFYRRLLAPLTAEPMTEDLEMELRRMDSLTPGDFKVVRDRFIFRPADEITPELMVKALGEEARIKSRQKGQKALGFRG